MSILTRQDHPPERMWVQTRNERFEARETEHGWRWRIRPISGWKALRPAEWKHGAETQMWEDYNDWCRP